MSATFTEKIARAYVRAKAKVLSSGKSKFAACVQHGGNG